jgi:hypothetical protein
VDEVLSFSNEHQFIETTVEGGEDVRFGRKGKATTPSLQNEGLANERMFENRQLVQQKRFGPPFLQKVYTERKFPFALRVQLILV